MKKDFDMELYKNYLNKGEVESFRFNSGDIYVYFTK